MTEVIDSIKQNIRNLRIPHNKILFLHVKLKNMKKVTGCSYDNCTELLLEALNYFHPVAILVPSFSYSFTKSGIYSRLFSKSEVGKFSEIIRLNYAKHRTLDPVFSVMDTSDLLQKIDDTGYKNAFDKGCVFEYLHNEDAVIINFDIKTMVSTQVHYIEKVNHVPYRYSKKFNGVIYHDDNTYEEITYISYVRDLQENLLLNWLKIEEYLLEQEVIQKTIVNGLKISWFTAQDMMQSISTVLYEEPYFLVS